MKSRQIYYIIAVLATLLIFINVSILVLRDKVDKYHKIVVHNKGEMILLGNEMTEQLGTAQHLFYDAIYRGDTTAKEQLKGIYNRFTGSAPRSESAFIYPEIQQSQKKLLLKHTTSTQQEYEVKLATASFEQLLQWMIANTTLDKDSLQTIHYHVWMIPDTDKSIKRMEAVAIQEMLTQENGSRKIFERLSMVIFYVIFGSILFFFIAVVYVFNRVLKPYFEGQETLHNLNQQMWRTANVVFWDYDMQKKAYVGGTSFAQFFGYNASAYHLSLAEIESKLEPGEFETINSIVQRAIKMLKRKEQFEFQFTDRYGEQRDVKVFAEFDYDENNALVRQHGILQDVTLQRRTEKDLEISRDRLDDILQKLEIGMAEVIPIHEREGITNLIFQNINSAFCQIFETNYSDVKEKTIYEVFPNTKMAWLRLMSSELSNVEDTVFRTLFDADLQKWINIKVYRETAQKMVVFAEDVTNDQVLKQALKKNQERLTLSEQMARLGYCEIDLDKRLIFGNENTWAIHGVSQNHKMSLDDLVAILHPEDQKAFENSLLKLNHLDKIEIIYRIEIKGKTRYIQCVLESTRINEQKYTAFGFVHDITPVKQVELELRKAKEKAEESERLKSAFLANMSHEIRTPLSAIVGFAGILAKNENVSKSEREECNQLIEKNSKSLMVLINDIVELSKIESGQINFTSEPVELNAFLDDVHQVFTHEIAKIGKNHLRIFINKSVEGELFVNTDTYRLGQIVNNLVSNAIKFTGKGFVEVGYDLSEDEDLVLYVRDSGIGIDTDKQKLIFEVFRQADLNIAGQFGGTGLGLAISSRLVELMGGKIWVESTKGIGSTFFFTLPFKSSSESQIEKSKALPKKGNPKKLQGKNILIADDEEFIHVLFRNYLQVTGANILSAYNGEQVIQYLNNGTTVDLILLDMRMPKLNGIETVNMLRGQHFQMPVIAQSAYAFTGDKEKFIAAGCDDYLAKPVDEDELIDTVYKYLS